MEREREMESFMRGVFPTQPMMSALPPSMEWNESYAIKMFFLFHAMCKGMGEVFPPFFFLG